ncbi:MAG: arylamine N-acetyltransferase [Salinirussus sp.]
MDADRYLDRLGLSPADVRSCSRETLTRLQRAHVTTVPFENLSIAGLPGGGPGPGVSLDLPALFEKVVDRERGGFCYELNAVFGWLLDDLGFETEQVAGVVLDDDEARLPANHLTTVVALDRRYVAEVGVGIPSFRRPLPLDGTVVTDGIGTALRAVPSSRPDADYAVQFREPGLDWETRYVFRDRARNMDYVAATCEYLTTAPESPFTGDPFATIATDCGHRKLKRGTLTTTDGGDTTREPVDPGEWPAVLERAFGIPCEATAPLASRDVDATRAVDASRPDDG